MVRVRERGGEGEAVKEKESKTKYSIRMHSVCLLVASLANDNNAQLRHDRPRSLVPNTGHAHMADGGDCRLAASLPIVLAACAALFPSLGAAAGTGADWPDRSPASISVSAAVNSNK